MTDHAQPLHVAGIQHDIVWEKPADNFAHLADMVGKAAADGARLVALTEMYSNGFSMNTGEIAEAPDGPSTQFLVDQAAANDIWLCGSLPEKLPGHDRPHNCLVVASPTGAVHRYRKLHRFVYAGESEHYESGDERVTIDVDGVRVSLFVCFDLRFAPDFWHVAHDTDLYVLVANWPAARSTHWTTLARARSIENQAYMLAVNRVGPAGDGLAHSGDSALFDPFGEIVAAAPADEECIISGTVDPSLVAQIRADYPFLAERTE